MHLKTWAAGPLLGAGSSGPKVLHFIWVMPKKAHLRTCSTTIPAATRCSMMDRSHNNNIGKFWVCSYPAFSQLELCSCVSESDPSQIFVFNHSILLLSSPASCGATVPLNTVEQTRDVSGCWNTFIACGTPFKHIFFSLLNGWNPHDRSQHD